MKNDLYLLKMSNLQEKNSKIIPFKDQMHGFVREGTII